MGVRDDVPYCALFPFFVFTFLPIKLEIARSEMYHYRICVRRGARLEGVCDLSAIDVGLWGNKACMRSCFPPLNGVFMSLGPCVACRLSEVVDLAWPSCIIRFFPPQNVHIQLQIKYKRMKNDSSQKVSMFCSASHKPDPNPH